MTALILALSRGSRRVAALAAGSAVLLVAACSLTKPEEEPAYVKATAVEERVDRIEHQSQAMLDMQRELEAAQAELRRLRGDLEETQHQAKTARDQQHDLYADLDKRIAAIEARLQTGQTAGGAVAGNDHDAYQVALDKLKMKDYPGAEKALRDFVASYPQSPLGDNALYWLGETYYVERRYGDALDAFQRMIREHPESRKVPDALLKAGYAQYEQKRYRESRELLARVLQSYPGSPAATDARERLKRLDAEQH